MAKGSRASDRASSGGGTGGSDDLRLTISVNTKKAQNDIRKFSGQARTEFKNTAKEVGILGKTIDKILGKSITNSYRQMTAATKKWGLENKKQFTLVRREFRGLQREARNLGSVLSSVYTGITGILAGREIQKSFRAAASRELAEARTGEVAELFGADSEKIQKGILDLRREGLFTYSSLAYSARQLASMNLEVEGSIEDLLRAFRNIAVVEGFYDDINFSITSFIKGIQTGTAELLENLSPRIRTMIVQMGGFAKIQQDVALRNQLLNNILRDGKIQQEAYNRVAATSEIRLKKLQTRYTELLETFGQGFLPVFNDIADVLDNVIVNLTSFLDSLEDNERRAIALTATFTTLTLLLAGPFINALRLINALFRTAVKVVTLYSNALRVLYSVLVSVMAVKAPLAAVLTAIIAIGTGVAAWFGLKSAVDEATESLNSTSDSAEKTYNEYLALQTQVEKLTGAEDRLRQALLDAESAANDIELEEHNRKIAEAAGEVDELAKAQLRLQGISKKLAFEGQAAARAKLSELLTPYGGEAVTGTAGYQQTVNEAFAKYSDPLQAERDRLRILRDSLTKMRGASFPDGLKGERTRRDLIIDLEDRIEKAEENVEKLNKTYLDALEKAKPVFEEAKEIAKNLDKFSESMNRFGGSSELQQFLSGGSGGASITKKPKGDSILPGFDFKIDDIGLFVDRKTRDIINLQKKYMSVFDAFNSLIIQNQDREVEKLKLLEKSLSKEESLTKRIERANPKYRSTKTLIENREVEREKIAKLKEELEEIAASSEEARKRLKQLKKDIEVLADQKELMRTARFANSISANLDTLGDAIEGLANDLVRNIGIITSSIGNMIMDFAEYAREAGYLNLSRSGDFGKFGAGVAAVGAGISVFRSTVGFFDSIFNSIFDNSEEQLKEIERQRVLQEAQNNYLKTLVDLEVDRQKSEREGIDREIERIESVAEREKSLLEGQFTGEELRKKQLEIDERTRNLIISKLDERFQSLQQSGVGSLYDPKDKFLVKQGGTAPTGRTQRERISQAILNREELMRIITEYQGEQAVLNAQGLMYDDHMRALRELESRYMSRIDPLLSEKDRERKRRSYGRYSNLIDREAAATMSFGDFLNTLTSMNESDTLLLTESLDVLNELYDLQTEGIKINNDLLGTIADNTKAVDLQQAQERGFSFIDISRGGLQQAGLFRGTRMSSLISDITTPTTLGNLVAVTEAKTTQQKMLDTLNDQLSELRIHTALLAKLTNSDPTRQVNDGLTTLSSALKVG